MHFLDQDIKDGGLIAVDERISNRAHRYRIRISPSPARRPFGPIRGATIRRSSPPSIPGLSYRAPRPLTSPAVAPELIRSRDRKSTRLNSSHVKISYAVFCLKK